MRSPADTTRPDLRDDRRKSRRQMSLMHVFRTAAEAGDAKIPPRPETTDAPEHAHRARRFGVDENELRRHLALDLESLISTVRLDAISDLGEGSRVARSVVNYGFSDLSKASGTPSNRKDIAEAIRASLIAFEPRLIPRSVDVQLTDETDEVQQRLTFHVQAEIAADPADLPLEFLAEVDLGAGKLKTKRLRLQK